MLHDFTWQQFLIAVLVLSLVWYGVLIGLFYPDRLKGLFGRKEEPLGPAEPLPHVWEADHEEVPEAPDDGLVGKTVLPEGMSQVGMSMFGFAPPVDEERERQQATVPDVIEELKNIFYVLDKEQGGKDDFMALFGLVRSKYPRIRGTANQAALNAYIRENALFPIADDELDSLWA